MTETEKGFDIEKAHQGIWVVSFDGRHVEAFNRKYKAEVFLNSVNHLEDTFRFLDTLGRFLRYDDPLNETRTRLVREVNDACLAGRQAVYDAQQDREFKRLGIGAYA